MDYTTDLTRLRAEMAVMSIYRDLGIPAGIAVHVDEIARHWADRGVRRSDLGGAIDGLVRRGLLSRTPEEPTLIARTLAGASWLEEQPAWLEYKLLVPRSNRIRYLQHSGSSRPAFKRRRRDDHAARHESR